MKTLSTIFLLTAFALRTAYAQTDTLIKIIADDYPVTDKMLRLNYKNVEIGGVTSLEKVWLVNDTLKQSLLFELATDYHRYSIYHFYNENMPGELMKEIELHVPEGKWKNSFVLASDSQKQASLQGFVAAAPRINQYYFTTNKGLKLGDKKEKAISVYGKPHTYSSLDGIEKYKWEYGGDQDYIETPRKNETGKPLAKDSWGYSVTMFFKQGKLIGMITYNGMP